MRNENEKHEASDTPAIVKERLKREADERLSTISREFAAGFEIIKNHPRSVTVFGSARFSESHTYYEKARSLAARLSKEGYTVVTGGGQGIMEAANRGAYEAGGDSVGFNIELPFEQTLNSYVTENMPFSHFYTRKVMLAFSAEAYVFFPGGFGTLDEFYELITLIQTYKIPRVPMILVGKEFWTDLHNTMRKVLIDDYQTISPGDLSLYTITEDEDEIVRIINSAPLRQE